MSGAGLLLRLGLAAVGALPDGVLRAGSRLLFSGSWRRFEEATERPREAQEARLLALVARAKDTEFGRAHRFAEIRGLEDYRARVPIRPFDGFEPYLARMVAGEPNVLIPEAPFFFARTSGTTGTPKHIPVTPLYVSEYRLPRRVWARQVMQAFPGLVRGKILTVHSPKLEATTERGVPVGSVTVGLTTQPGAVEGALAGAPWDAAPRSIFLLDDFELKYHVLLRLAAQAPISLAAAINPSTLVLLAEKLDRHAEELARDLESGGYGRLDALPEPIRGEVRAQLERAPKAARRLLDSKARHGRVIPTELWPRLAGLICWTGGSAPFYLAQLERLFPGKQVMDYGFLATEGGFSIPLGPGKRGGVVSVAGHVLEFVPEAAMARGETDGARLADELELGERYRVVVTGAHGLYRYDINDVVECVGRYRNTAEIAFLHKGGHMLSVTGEKVAESHVVRAAARAEAEVGLPLVGFTATCALEHPPRYVLAVEPRGALEPAGAQRLLAAFDAALSAENVEYAAKRGSLRLGAPRLVVLRPGAYEAERRRRVAAGAPDSHVKPPHLVRDAALLDGLGIEASYEAEG